MPKTIIKIKTWTCPICDYQQDFEPTQDNQNKHFNQDIKFPLNNLLQNECPSCKLKGLVSFMTKEVNDNKKLQHTIIGEEDIDTEIKDINTERIKKGKAKMKAIEESNYKKIRKEDIRLAIIKANELKD